MINAILTALNEGAPNMLLTLLLISLLVIWLQSKLNKEFGSLREDIAKMDKDLRKLAVPLIAGRPHRRYLHQPTRSCK